MPLSRLNAVFADIIAAFTDGNHAIFELAADGTVAEWGHSAERLYGFSAAEMVGNRPTLLVPGDLVHTERRRLESAFADGRALRAETRRIAKDGTVRHVSLNLVPLRDHSGAVIRVAAVERELTAAAEPAAVHASVRQPFRGNETILVVDDERPIRDAICRVLKQNGYAAFGAVDGEDALRVAEVFPGPIHLVLSDVVMPQMDGRALFARIRTWYPEIRFMFMSGAEPEFTSTDVFSGSRTRFLVKPFGMNRLLAEVREALDDE